MTFGKPLGGAVANARAIPRPITPKPATRAPHVVIVYGINDSHHERSLRQKSRAQRGTVFIEIMGRHILRDGVIVEAPRPCRRLLLALFTAQGRLLTNEQMVDSIYIDDENGGAENSSAVLSAILSSTMDIAAALGLKVERFHGIGVRLLDASGVPT